MGAVFSLFFAYVVNLFGITIIKKINWYTLFNDNYICNEYFWGNQFYAENMFEEIKEYTDKKTDVYRVVSIGIFPSIDLQNGFYCLDGYSNNYSLEYKHESRFIIEKEL